MKKLSTLIQCRKKGLIANRTDDWSPLVEYQDPALCEQILDDYNEAAANTKCAVYEDLIELYGVDSLSLDEQRDYDMALKMCGWYKN